MISILVALIVFMSSCGSSSSWENRAGQTAIINKLSQKIGISDSDNNLTITVDSATGSEKIYYILVRVEGYSFDHRYQYSFDTRRLDVDKDSLPDALRIGSYGIRYLGTDTDGSGLFLIDLSFGTLDVETENIEELPIILSLENMTRRSNQQEKIVNEGQWTFSFTLDRSQLPEKITLPDLQVNGVNVDTGETLPVTLTDIVLSNTGIQYKFDCNHGKIDVYGNISVLLKDGSRINDGQGTGIIEDDNETHIYTWHWSIPIDIEEVSSITIAGVDICVPSEA